MDNGLTHSTKCSQSYEEGVPPSGSVPLTEISALFRNYLGKDSLGLKSPHCWI
jgi:hypothetical protein